MRTAQEAPRRHRSVMPGLQRNVDGADPKAAVCPLAGRGYGPPEFTPSRALSRPEKDVP